MSTYAVIPITKLESVKSRLYPFLNSRLRRELSFKMLTDITNAIKNSKEITQTVVVTPDDRVLEVAKRLGVNTLKENFARGVNAAVSFAMEYCLKKGASKAIILPSDIPLLSHEDLHRIIEIGTTNHSIVIGPSVRFDGTNVLLCNPPRIIQTHYEQNSFRSHIAEAIKNKVKVVIYLSKRIMLDIDSPKDLQDFLKVKNDTLTHKFLKEQRVL
ncbi:MAG: 2-phospho-L-lactate guanylyltransferase [Candidatus Bathyarchaeota archaeon]